MSFINCSNHPSIEWSDYQKDVSLKYGKIIDVLFPDVSPEITEQDVYKLADEIVDRILSYEPQAVMCQGEFTLTYEIVRRLKAAGVEVLAACSYRKACEQMMPDGSKEKISIFEFVQYRKY